MQIVPESIRKLWNEWELRVMVLISLSLQIILIIFSNRRKYSGRIWVRVILWLTYLSADWAATVSLGVLCNSQQDSDSTDGALQPDSKIMAFWAPFLLLHLGGPDTITAYALEDNELWLRHFLGLLIQVGVAFYVFLRSWTTGTYNLITFLAIPMFITGIIKYGERTYVLWSASSGHFRDSLLPHPNAGSDYVKLIKEHRDDEEAFETEFRRDAVRDKIDRDNRDNRDNILPDARIFHEAHSFFEIFRRLYADLIFSLPEIKHSYEVFCKKTPKDAFKVIELELSFMYDVLYTKASLVYSLAGGFLRPICFISTVSAFVGFLILDKHGYSTVDIMISYVLLVGAIVLEMYAVIILLSSDWTMLWLRKPKSPILNGINQAISSLHSAMNEKKRWSNTISQYNLISFCLRRKPTKCLGIQNIFGIYEMLEKYQQIVVKDVSVEQKEYIFKHILQKAKSLAGSYEGVAKFCSWRGDEVLRNFGTSDELSWSIEVDFDESILLWHIATHLHYDTENKFASAHFHKSRISMLLSDYMLYVLVMRPFMLPKGIGQIRFQDTVAEAERFFEDRGLTSIEIAQEKLLEVDCQYTEVEVKGDVSKSVLFDGCRLAKTVESLSGQNEQIWEMISDVWVEMLCYAANQCRWNQHAQQLRRGGELLTHISLLMTHLGLTEQLKVIRIREDVENEKIRRNRLAARVIRNAYLFEAGGQDAMSSETL